MPFPLIAVGSAIAELVLPQLGKWIAGDKGEKVAGQVVGMAQTITGTGDPEAALAALRQSAELQAKLQKRLIEVDADLERENTARLAEINATMRAEIASSDAFVRRSRPAFLYIIALAFGVQIIGMTLVGGAAVLAYPAQAGGILKGLAEVVGATIALYGVALPVCGVYLSKRSQDKAVEAGHAPLPGILDRLLPGRSAT